MAVLYLYAATMNLHSVAQNQPTSRTNARVRVIFALLLSCINLLGGSTICMLLIMMPHPPTRHDHACA